MPSTPDSIIYKLSNVKNRTKNEIADLIKNGAKFKVFTYPVSILVVNYMRLSDAILIENKIDFEHYRKKYNRKSLLLGPWQLYKGPPSVYKSIKHNNKGGLDVTKDILLNLDFYDRDKSEVELRTLYTLFDRIPKNEFKELQKAIKQFCNEDPEIQETYAGQYINVGDYYIPPYIVGCRTTYNDDKIEELLKDKIYKRFRKYVQFEIITENSKPELYERLQEQGAAIIENNQPIIRKR